MIESAGARPVDSSVRTGGLRGRTLVGIKWSSASQIASQLLQFAVSVALARMLSPREFGLMGMILVFTGFASIFNDLGLGAALVQRNDLEDRHLNSVFWVNVAAGAIWTAAFALLSFPIAAFYGEPALQALTVAVSLNLFLGSTTIVQHNLLVRSMDFRRLFIVNLTAIVCSGSVAVVGALAGFGVWSLIAQSLVMTAVSAAMLWWMMAWRPRLSFDRGAIRDLFGYSANLLGFHVLNYSNRNLDNLLIGKYIDSASLGVYSRAYTLMLLPIRQVTSILTRVMFPAMSAIQDDVAKVKRIYMRATRTISLITFPLMVGLLVVAEPFVLVIYGQKWHEVVPIIQILCLTGIEQSISTTVGWIYNSQGRTDVQLRWGVYDFLLTTTAFVVGLPWGIVGIAVSYVVFVNVIGLYPSWTMAGRLINMRFGEMAKNLAQTFFCAAAMGAAVWAAGLLLPAHWPSWAHLAVQVPSGVVIYGVLIHFLQVKAYMEVRELVAEQLLSRSGAAAGMAP